MPTTLSKFSRLFLAVSLAMALSLSGCNKLRFGYEYADWLVLYSIEDNFDLEKPQRSLLKGDVEEYFKWHRKTLLPQYANLLQGAADSLKRGMRPDGVDTGYQAFRVLLKMTLEPIPGKAAAMLVSLNPAQVDNWYEKQQKKNQRFHRDFSGTAEERMERRAEKIVEELEDWTGKLTKDQRRQVRTLSYTLPWNGHLWLQNREKAQARLLELLKARVPKGEVEKFLEDYFLYPERLRSDEYNAQYRITEAKIRTMILRIHALLTPQQRKHAIGLIQNLAKDFKKMSSQE